MKEEEYLEKLRSIYRSTRATPRLAFSGWNEISVKIDGGNRNWFGFPAKGWALGLLSLLLLVGWGFVFYGSVKAALPDEALYPIKIFSEDVFSKVSGNSQIKVDNRAEEIVNLVEKKSEDTEALQKVSSEYANEVSKIKNDIPDSGQDGQDLREHLEEDYKKFNEAVREFPEAEKDIKEAMAASKQDHSSERD